MSVAITPLHGIKKKLVKRRIQAEIMSAENALGPWYNNCHIAGSMSDEQWEELQEKFYTKQPQFLTE